MDIIGTDGQRFQEAIQKDKRRVGWFHMGVLFAGIIALTAFGNAPHATVELPIMDSSKTRQLMEERDLYKKQRDDSNKKNELLVRMLQTSNGNVQRLTAQLEALAVSLPPQPVILKEIQKEAATEQGFRKVVARSFGKELAANIQIIGD